MAGPRFPCMGKRRIPVQLGSDGLPERLRWRPVIEGKSLLVGALFTIGGVVLLQQLGLATLDLAELGGALAVGLALGIAVPSLGRLWGVLRANRMLRRARAGAGAP